MSRALRLVVTQKESISFPTALKNIQRSVRSGILYKNNTEYAVVSKINVLRTCRNERRSEYEFFWTHADAKIVRSKMLSLYRRELYKNWFARFGSKVRKMNDQKLTLLRRISKVTHSRKQWTEIEVGKFEFDIPAIC